MFTLTLTLVNTPYSLLMYSNKYAHTPLTHMVFTTMTHSCISYSFAFHMCVLASYSSQRSLTTALHLGSLDPASLHIYHTSQHLSTAHTHSIMAHTCPTHSLLTLTHPTLTHMSHTHTLTAHTHIPHSHTHVPHTLTHSLLTLTHQCVSSLPKCLHKFLQ